MTLAKNELGKVLGLKITPNFSFAIDVTRRWGARLSVCEQRNAAFVRVVLERKGKVRL